MEASRGYGQGDFYNNNRGQQYNYHGRGRGWNQLQNYREQPYPYQPYHNNQQ